MIRELATLRIDEDRAEAFEDAVARAAPLFEAAEGCTGMALERVIEKPGCYILRVDWARLEDHTERFRSSPAFTEWRALAGPFFTSPPSVIHVRSERFF